MMNPDTANWDSTAIIFDFDVQNAYQLSEWITRYSKCTNKSNNFNKL